MRISPVVLVALLAGCGLQADPPDDPPEEARPAAKGGPRQTLTVVASAGGTVTGAGISCPGACSASYPYGTSVSLVAAPATGYRFGGWSGACTGTGACTVTMTTARNVAATFIQQVHLGVVTSGPGSVAVSPPGGTYDYGTAVTLTAQPAAGATFVGWSGACAGASPVCGLTLTGDTSVAATFATLSYTLSVNLNAPGQVIVNGSACSSSCAYSFQYGSTVTIQAAPGYGSIFERWTGTYASAANPLSFTMTQNVSETANLGMLLYSTGVSYGGKLTLSGTSGGSAVSYTCDGDLSQCPSGYAFVFDYGSTVSVTATLDTTGYGWYISSWDGMANGAVPTSKTSFSIENVGTPSQEVMYLFFTGTYWLPAVTARPFSEYHTLGASFWMIIG